MSHVVTRSTILRSRGVSTLVHVPTSTNAFDTGIDARDQFLGRRRCVICGDDIRVTLQPCLMLK